MKAMKLVVILAAASSIVLPSAWSQEADPTGGTKQSKEPSANVKDAAKQSEASSKLKIQRAALQREAEAIEARHAALDQEIAAWSENLGRWIKEQNIAIDPAQVVLSLSSRSYFLHEAKHSENASDAAYSRFEDQMKEIQEKRKKMEADWLDVLSRYGLWVARNHVKTFELQRSFDFNFGDSTIPIPGISARQGCCPLTIPGHDCLQPSEFCVRKGKTGWERRCLYVCDIVLGPAQ